MEPLTLTPILKRLRWGGRRLGTELGKPIGAGDDYAESWEVCDHGADQTLVADGTWKGRTLGELVTRQGEQLLGRHRGLAQFPLLCKFLDASDRLSVQVHPNDAQADAHQPGERGKTEAWVILDARPGSCVFAGLKRHVTRADLQAALAQGTVADCLHRVAVKAGDCLFIPAGTVHALGEGVLLAEVQQSSDLTFRLFDWNRVDREGKSRPLHVEESLAVTDFERGPVDPVVPAVAGDAAHCIERLVDCPYFNIRRHTAREAVAFPPADRCRILIGLAGTGQIEGTSSPHALARGQTLLIPACSPGFVVAPQLETAFLEVDWD